MTAVLLEKEVFLIVTVLLIKTTSSISVESSQRYLWVGFLLMIGLVSTSFEDIVLKLRLKLHKLKSDGLHNKKIVISL